MSYNNDENTFLFILNKRLRDTRFNTEQFLRGQFFYFSLANIRLNRYDSFFRFILLLSGDINFKPVPTTVTNNIILLNTLPFHNCGEPTMPSECNSLSCYKAHDNYKLKIFKKKDLHIFHLNINSLLPESMKIVLQQNSLMLL